MLGGFQRRSLSNGPSSLRGGGLPQCPCTGCPHHVEKLRAAWVGSSGSRAGRSFGSVSCGLRVAVEGIRAFLKPFFFAEGRRRLGLGWSSITRGSPLTRGVALATTDVRRVAEDGNEVRVRTAYAPPAGPEPAPGGTHPSLGPSNARSRCSSSAGWGFGLRLRRAESRRRPGASPHLREEPVAGTQAVRSAKPRLTGTCRFSLRGEALRVEHGSGLRSASE